MKKINDKISQINEFFEEFNSFIPNNFEEYEKNIEKKAACERYVEKIVEASIDLAFLIIKYKKLKLPGDDIDSFNILLDNKIIEKELATNLKNAKGMRNILAHQYGSISDEVVFNAIKDSLEKDIKRFMKITDDLFKS